MYFSTSAHSCKAYSCTSVASLFLLRSSWQAWRSLEIKSIILLADLGVFEALAGLEVGPAVGGSSDAVKFGLVYIVAVPSLGFGGKNKASVLEYLLGPVGVARYHDRHDLVHLVLLSINQDKKLHSRIRLSSPSLQTHVLPAEVFPCKSELSPCHKNHSESAHTNHIAFR